MGTTSEPQLGLTGAEAILDALHTGFRRNPPAVLAGDALVCARIERADRRLAGLVPRSGRPCSRATRRDEGPMRQSVSWLCLAAATALAGEARAEAVTSGVAQAELPAAVYRLKPASAEPAESERAPPIVLSATYTGEVWSTLRGGTDPGGAYLDKIEAVTELEGSGAWKGISLRASALFTNGASISADRLGDLQGVSNIEGDGVLRLYEAWARIQGDAGAVKVGVIDLNTELDVNEVGALFINSAHGIGPDFSQAGPNGPSIFPVTGLGVVGTVSPSHRWTLKGGAFDGAPGASEGAGGGAVFRLRRSEGVLLAMEARRSGPDGDVLSIGHWRHSEWGGEREHRARRASFGGYAMLSGDIADLGPRRLDGFIRVGAAHGGEIEGYIGGGLVLSGPLVVSSEDQMGLAFGALDLADGFLQVLDPSARRGREVHVELTYRAPVFAWAAIQPTVQYVRTPGALKGARSAWVAGIRLTVGGAYPQQ